MYICQALVVSCNEVQIQRYLLKCHWPNFILPPLPVPGRNSLALPWTFFDPVHLISPLSFLLLTILPSIIAFFPSLFMSSHHIPKIFKFLLTGIVIVYPLQSIPLELVFTSLISRFVFLIFSTVSFHNYSKKKRALFDCSDVVTETFLVMIMSKFLIAFFHDPGIRWLICWEKDSSIPV